MRSYLQFIRLKEIEQCVHHVDLLINECLSIWIYDIALGKFRYDSAGVKPQFNIACHVAHRT